MIGKSYLLRNWDSGIQTQGSGDMVLITRAGTNASSDHDVSLSGIVRPGATVYAVQMVKKTLSATSVLDSDAAMPSDGDVLTLILVDPHDLQNHGD